MLYVYKQIKGVFRGFIESNLLDKNIAIDIADKIDSNNSSKLGKEEVINFLKKENLGKKREIRDLVKKIWNENWTKYGNNGIPKQEFINLLTNQENEHNIVSEVYQGTKNSITKGGKRFIGYLKDGLDIEDINFKGIIKRGSNNVSAIKFIQDTLGMKDLGRGYGKFGPKTEKAVRNFQKMYGLEVDGIVGKQTREQLDYVNNTFDDDLNSLKNSISKGIDTVKDYIHPDLGEKLDFKAKYHYKGNNNTEYYDVYLKSDGGKFTLTIDDLGKNTFKTFSSKPTNNEIKSYLNQYSKI